MFKSKIVSSLEKAFLDENIDKFDSLERISALRGERLSVQLLYTYEIDEEDIYQRLCQPTLSGSLAEYTKLGLVRHVPVDKPTPKGYRTEKNDDGGWLRTTPGVYPDLIEPVTYNGRFRVLREALNTLWIDIEIPADAPAGEQALTIDIAMEYPDKSTKHVGKHTLTVDVIAAELPEQKLMLTQWFYTDCIANYYDLEVWSEKHWEYIENFARVAAKNGINMLLTPVFTPELDTVIGGERLTTQLVGIKKTGDRYFYNWKLLDRWIEMCNRVGIKYFEVAHLFSQWGATHAPKIMATVDGEYKRIFGWETDAHGEEYKKFMRSFLKAFLKHMKTRGDDKRCFFHVSDEPNEAQLEDYKKSKRIVQSILKDYVIMDALSSFEFYKRGVVKTPIPANNHITPFIEANVPNLWTYYCCGQVDKVSNRMIAMPGWRNRSIGMQMYKYNIVGFLQWGYNFYNNCGSVDDINPYLDCSGDKWVSAGDTYSVYPGKRGVALESTRIVVFHQGLQDMRAMQLCESYYGHEAVVAAIEEVLGETLLFTRCAYSSAEMLAIREKINAMIKDAISE